MGRSWVVVPVFNEATVLAEVLEGLRSGGFEHVVCVDDGSSDDSVAIARRAGVAVVEHPINLGQGASLQTGFDFALADPLMTEVVTFDSDGQHQVADAREMVRRLRDEHLDVVIGSRFLDDRTVVGPVKKAVLRTAALYTRLTTGLPLTDAHNGLRVLSRTVLERVRITQNRMAHASELIDEIGSLKVPWAEHPTHIVYTEYSKSKGQSLLNSINILVDLLLR
jgi:polyprenyl-phospho-N-acetylgalactosaminyl synthase